MISKGIILAGGRGSRLNPVTKYINKQLLPIYNKPMIYYSLTTLMLAQINSILIITNEEYIPNFYNLLQDGSHLGINIQYAKQEHPRGIGDAFIIGQEFIGNNHCALLLGDNLLCGESLSDTLVCANLDLDTGAHIFGIEVENPREFGVIEFDSYNRIINLEEKPLNPKSNFAIPGI